MDAEPEGSDSQNIEMCMCIVHNSMQLILVHEACSFTGSVPIL